MAARPSSARALGANRGEMGGQRSGGIVLRAPGFAISHTFDGCGRIVHPSRPRQVPSEAAPQTIPPSRSPAAVFRRRSGDRTRRTPRIEFRTWHRSRTSDESKTLGRATEVSPVSRLGRPLMGLGPRRAGGEPNVSWKNARNPAPFEAMPTWSVRLVAPPDMARRA